MPEPGRPSWPRATWHGRGVTSSAINNDEERGRGRTSKKEVKRKKERERVYAYFSYISTIRARRHRYHPPFPLIRFSPFERPDLPPNLSHPPDAHPSRFLPREIRVTLFRPPREMKSYKYFPRVYVLEKVLRGLFMHENRPSLRNIHFSLQKIYNLSVLMIYSLINLRLNFS